MQRRRGINVNSFTVHRILLTTLMLAAKFLDDYVASNRVWAFAGGVSVKQLNSMERRFLELISFDLYAEVPELENTKEKMKKLCIKRNQFAGVM